MQDIRKADRLRGDVEHGPVAQTAIEAVDGGVEGRCDVVDVHKTGACGGVGGDRERVAAGGPERGDGTPPRPEVPSVAAIEDAGAEDDGVDGVARGEDGLLVRGAPRDHGRRLVGCEPVADGREVGHTLGRGAVYHCAGGVDEAKLGSDGAFFGEGSLAIVGDGDDCLEDGGGLVVALGDVHDGVDIMGAQCRFECRVVFKREDERGDLSGDEGFRLGSAASLDEDGIGACAQQGLGEGTAQ